METLAEIWVRNARYRPDRLALVFEDRRTTHGALYERALKLANALARLGVRKHDRVAMYAMNRHEWFELYGACHLASFIAATVNFRLAAPEIAFILQDSSPRVLVFEAQYAGVVDSLRAALPAGTVLVCIGEAPDWALGFDDVLGSGSMEQPAAPGPDDYGSLVYTSGTTGRPKGVLKTQAQLLVGYERNGVVMGLGGGDRMLLGMPLFHVGATSLGFGAFCAGASVVLHRQFDPAETLRTIARERITTGHMAPTMLQAIMDVPDLDSHDLSSMRVINYAAAPMPVTLLRRCVAKFGRIFLSSYGATESGGTVLYPSEHYLEGSPAQLRRLGSVGEPFPDAAIRIVDDHGQPVPDGTPGEIIMRSKGTMSGYWNNTAATIEAIRDGWYYSGDIGYLDEQGFLFIVDRKKDMIISGGENIYCREVEEALMAHPGIVDAAVIGVPDPFWGEAVNAIVIRAPRDQHHGAGALRLRHHPDRPLQAAQEDHLRRRPAAAAEREGQQGRLAGGVWRAQAGRAGPRLTAARMSLTRKIHLPRFVACSTRRKLV